MRLRDIFILLGVAFLGFIVPIVAIGETDDLRLIMFGMSLILTLPWLLPYIMYRGKDIFRKKQDVVIVLTGVSVILLFSIIGIVEFMEEQEFLTSGTETVPSLITPQPTETPLHANTTEQVVMKEVKDGIKVGVVAKPSGVYAKVELNERLKKKEKLLFVCCFGERCTFGEYYGNASYVLLPLWINWTSGKEGLIGLGKYDVKVYSKWKRVNKSIVEYLEYSLVEEFTFDVKPEDLKGADASLVEASKPVEVRNQENPWQDNLFKIYIDANTAPEIYRDNYVDAFRKAMRWWEEGGNGALAYQPIFDEVSDPKEAEILVYWAPDVVTGVGEEPFGLTSVKYVTYYENGNEKELFLKAVIALQYLEEGKEGYVDFATMLRVAKHELGHALGLAHSPNVSDIMYPQLR